MKSDQPTAAWDTEFEDLDEAILAIESLRAGLLFGELADQSKEVPVSEQHFLIALAALEQAKANLRLADYHRTREIAAARLGR